MRERARARASSAPPSASETASSSYVHLSLVRAASPWDLFPFPVRQSRWPTFCLSRRGCNPFAEKISPLFAARCARCFFRFVRIPSDFRAGDVARFKRLKYIVSCRCTAVLCKHFTKRRHLASQITGIMVSNYSSLGLILFKLDFSLVMKLLNLSKNEINQNLL